MSTKHVVDLHLPQFRFSRAILTTTYLRWSELLRWVLGFGVVRPKCQAPMRPISLIKHETMSIVLSSAIFPSPNRICKMSDNRCYVNYIHLHT